MSRRPRRTTEGDEKPMDELSEYERKRLENIRENNAVLAELHLAPGTLGIRKSNKRKAYETRPKKSRKNPEVDNPPRRSSLRLRGIKIDSDRHEQDRQTMSTVEGGRRQKFPRKGGDFSLTDMLGGEGIGEDGCGDLAGALRLASSLPSPSRRREKKEADEENSTVERQKLDTTLSRQLAKLSIRHAPVKVTPQRIYSQAFHSSPEQRLLAAGDKTGYLGFLKLGAEGTDPQVWAIKPHTQTISRVLFSPADTGVLFTSSYDGSVRQLDLVTSKSTEAFSFAELAGLRLAADVDDEDDCLITCVDVPRDSPNTLWFSDISGRVGRRDMRAQRGGAGSTSMFQLSERKIGCISVTNDGGHIVTSSLDKMMRIWDVRYLSSVRTDGGKEETSGIQDATWEWQHDLSVTAAYWSPSNNWIVSTAYDDKLRVFDDPRGKVELGKPICIPHDNQTGRWISVFRSVWHPNPEYPIIITGNKKRGIDVHDAATGSLLALLRDPDNVSAVPAVVCSHPSDLMVAGGNAAGKVVVFS